MASQMADQVRTEHPHIVRAPGIAGGRPTIEGTRISVVFIVRQLRTGDTPEDIVALFPNLTLATVHDAISYYYDHQEEIDRYIEDNSAEALQERLGFTYDEIGRIVFPAR
jgi:uncharacterized protein (DUF433 family)